MVLKHLLDNSNYFKTFNVLAALVLVYSQLKKKYVNTFMLLTLISYDAYNILNIL